ncbi:MAG: hypothetical protein H6581_30395 [Bacteroidia bacterium]|nr:hypothetical protein [Bacteroidia bacterium]
MERINKRIRFSKEYKSWLEDLERNNLPHPSYNSSNGKYYPDILMELLKIQRGCCAYTQKRLCQDESVFAPQNWVEGKYQGKISSSYGELEHFDEGLKVNKAWDWENLFVVDEKVNKNKGSAPVDYILKPDLDSFLPEDLLSYHIPTHRFVANPRKSSEEKIRIKEMIKILGLNFPVIQRDRGSYLNENRKKDGFSSQPNQYFAAFRHCKAKFPR